MVLCAAAVVRGDAFRGRQFTGDVILWAVRLSLRFPKSDHDREPMLRDHEVMVDHKTIIRWIQTYAAELEKRLRPHLSMSNGSWRVDKNPPYPNAVAEMRGDGELW